MTREQWEESLGGELPPQGCPPLLLALWWERRGDWERAHGIAQEIENRDAAWVHAYLHRREGDPGNAAYWYRQARRPVATGAFADEWQEITDELLTR